MAMIDQIRHALARFIEPVATTILAAIERVLAPRRLVLVEATDGSLALTSDQHPTKPTSTDPRFRIAEGSDASDLSMAAPRLKGSRVELVVTPGKILFRPIELPGRASEFLDGIIRAQVDRLTPWAARDAAFGWSRPQPAGSDRIALTIAATARATLMPYVKAIAERGARSVSIFVVPPGGDAGAQPIKIYEHSAHGAIELAAIKRVLLVVLVGASVLASTAITANLVVGGYLDGRRDNVSQQLDALRSELHSGRESAPSTLRALDRRKHELASSVLLLEALSRALPDDTYVTELRIEGNKLQLTGMSRDAAALIGLIERSPHFVRASFSAPTTRSPGASVEQFHIEAIVQPIFTQGS